MRHSYQEFCDDLINRPISDEMRKSRVMKFAYDEIVNTPASTQRMGQLIEEGKPPLLAVAQDVSHLFDTLKEKGNEMDYPQMAQLVGKMIRYLLDRDYRQTEEVPLTDAQGFGHFTVAMLFKRRK